MKYKCIKSFEIPIVDEDYNHTEEMREITMDSVWEIDEGTLNVVDSTGIRIINDVGVWIELYREDLEEFFEALKREST